MAEINMTENATDLGVSEEQEARSRVEAYLAPLYADPLTDGRSLSARGACKEMRMSFNTLKKYGLEKRLKAAAEHRKAKQETAGIGSGSRMDQLVARLRAERDEWKQEYANLMEQYISLQYAVGRNPGIDAEKFTADAVFRGIPKAVRNAPGRGKKKRGRNGSF